MNKIILISVLLISTHSMHGQFSLRFSQLRRTIAAFTARFNGARTFKQLMRPATQPAQPVIDLKNPPSLMKAVHEQNYALIQAALKAGVSLHELDRHGKNASGVAFQNLRDYDAKLVANGWYQKAFFAQRANYLKTVQVFDDYQRSQRKK